MGPRTALRAHLAAGRLAARGLGRPLHPHRPAQPHRPVTWGAGAGGRTWQRWLSGSGSYAEIQAGLARTQLEHLRLDLLLGHCRHAAGDTEAARGLWRGSADAHDTPDARRALGLTSTTIDERCAQLVRAHELDPHRAGIAIEALTALLEAGRHDAALTVIADLPDAVRELPRVAYLECWALVRCGDADAAAALLERPLVVPDLREGDVGLDQLWDEYQALRGTREPLPAHYDFRMRP